MMPKKHVLVCEDDTSNQALMAMHFASTFDPQGEVEFSFVPGGMHAAAIFGWRTVDLVILDHDMPHGNGADLVKWMRANGHQTPILTFSGIPQNNAVLMQLGASHHFIKNEVLDGKADALIRQLLGL
jgi:CheY-like chemotaxis protein